MENGNAIMLNKIKKEKKKTKMKKKKKKKRKMKTEKKKERKMKIKRRFLLWVLCSNLKLL
jgi:hypothetical protein